MCRQKKKNKYEMCCFYTFSVLQLYENMATGPAETFLVSAAIDFGTTYSGYAYSLRE